MDQEESTLCTTSISDYHSVGSRNHTGRQQTNAQQLLRLKAENEEITSKFIKLSNEYNKLKKLYNENIKKLQDTDLFYAREIENLKKQIQDKSKEFSKYSRYRPKKNFHGDKENSVLNGNSVMDFSCIENQTNVLGEVRSENEKLHDLLNETMAIFEPYILGKELGKDFFVVRKRFQTIKKELSQKSANNAVFSKANELLEETRVKMDDDHDNQINKLMMTLKAKTKQLKAPLVFDYDLEEETKNLQILFNNLDIELRQLKSQKQST